ncbi:PIG-L deacetylase family protein [Trinickia soli]|nr:PIG-L family deacetylase [Trinickia soli]CAB3716379.1 hypothetical protein LMG24076_04328 [Trinickia soli]
MQAPLPSFSLDVAPCFVVSPHLDDAVFSCGMLLASRPGSVVCTVFCGIPQPPMRTPWDQSAGHSDSTQAMRSRIVEDEQALALLGARAVRLPFFDSQYEATPSSAEVAQALATAWRQNGRLPVVAPLGLHHSDHVLVADACRLLAHEQRLPDMILYEESPYRTIPAVARRRYEALNRQGYRFALLSESQANDPSMRRAGAANAKWRAVHAYRSQLRAFNDAHPHDLTEPERYVRLAIDRARPPRR